LHVGYLEADAITDIARWRVEIIEINYKNPLSSARVSIVIVAVSVDEARYPARTTSRPLGEMEAAVKFSLTLMVASFSNVGLWNGVAEPAV
jgi:hypothetical protein